MINVVEYQALPDMGSSQQDEKLAYKEVMKERAKTLACPNEECEKYGAIGEGNVVFRNSYGDQPSQNLFRCKWCNKTFSERNGTPFLGFHLSEEKIVQIIKCLVEGNGTRATARICGVHRDTVTKIIRRFGTHADQISHLFLQNYPLKECQLDELWSFIKKNKKISQP